MDRSRVVELLPDLSASECMPRLQYPTLDVTTPHGTFTIEFLERTDVTDPWGPVVGYVRCEQVTYRGYAYQYQCHVRVSTHQYDKGVKLPVAIPYLRVTTNGFYPTQATPGLAKAVSALLTQGGAIYEAWASRTDLQQAAEDVARKNAQAEAVDNVKRCEKLLVILRQRALDA